MIGRIAFWLLLPGLIATVVELGALLYLASGPSIYYEADRIGVLGVFVFFFVLFVSMTIQALLIVRRPQSLTTRRLPTRIAVLQLALYAIAAGWVLALTRSDIGALSVVLGVVMALLSIAQLVLILSWPRDPSERAEEVALPTGLRIVLWAYILIALVALMLAFARAITPTLDPTSGLTFTVLTVLGQPLALLTVPFAVVGALAGFYVDVLAVSVPPVVLNMAAVLLVLAPRTRVRLVNWFFKLGRA